MDKTIESELTIADYEEVLADKRRLTREIDVAMHGEEGAAKQASLCDLIEPAKRMRAEIQRLRESLRNAADHLDIASSFLPQFKLVADNCRKALGGECA